MQIRKQYNLIKSVSIMVEEGSANKCYRYLIHLVCLNDIKPEFSMKKMTYGINFFGAYCLYGFVDFKNGKFGIKNFLL